MANLIPPDAKKEVITKYWLRVCTVWFVLIGCGLIVVLALKLPTYVELRTAISAYSTESADTEHTIEASLEAQETIREANDLIAVLQEEKQGTQFTELVDILDDIAGADVSLYRYKFQKEDGALRGIEINGVASTRLSLSSFGTDIEAHPLFGVADYPFSNLAQGDDIEFAMVITPAEE